MQLNHYNQQAVTIRLRSAIRWSLLLWIPALVAISCSQVDDRKVQKVRDLNGTLGEIETMMSGIDTAKVGKLLKECTASLEYVNNNYNREMPREVAIFLSDYRETRKALKFVVEKHQQHSAELEYSKAQVKALLRDLEYNLVSEKQLEENLPTEQKAIQLLLDKVNLLQETHSRALKEYSERNPRVQDMVAEIKSNYPPS